MQIDIRNLQITDYDELRETMQKAYPAMSESIWSKKSIQKLIKIFPDGQICITVDGKIAAVCLALKVQYELFGDDHTYKEITGDTPLTRIPRPEMFCMELKFSLILNSANCGWREDYMTRAKIYVKN